MKLAGCEAVNSMQLDEKVVSYPGIAIAQAPLIEDSGHPSYEPSLHNIHFELRSFSEEYVENHKLHRITQKAIDVFLASSNQYGGIDGIGYWQAANGYTAIALHDIWSRNHSNAPKVHHQLAITEVMKKGFINDFNDDSTWYAVCLLEMHRLTRHPHYLRGAEKIWHHVHKSVIFAGKVTFDGTDMEGGVKWTTRAEESQINAISTGLFAELSARLSQLSQTNELRQQYSEAALHSLFWILRCRYVENKFLVLDTIDLRTKEKFDWTFTYNTGQAMSAAIAIYDALKHPYHPSWSNSSTAMPHLKLACNMAQRAMTRRSWVEEDGTLTERTAYPGGNEKKAWENDDAVGFKSILIRSLTKLYLTLKRDGLEHDLQAQIAKFIARNFISLQRRDTNGNGQYGPWWAGPMDQPTSHSQLAVLDVMAAVHAIIHE